MCRHCPEINLAETNLHVPTKDGYIMIEENEDELVIYTESMDLPIVIVDPNGDDVIKWLPPERR